jgi:DICT domain-containing protein
MCTVLNVNLYNGGFGIGELALRTGVGIPTLRAWERRHGFPAPQRLAGGHRRYTERDVAAVREIVRERSAGVPVREALARARERAEAPRVSIGATLQRALPDVGRVLLSRRSLIAISHAIEDEVSTRGDRPIVLGAFQRPDLFAPSASRWRDLARTSSVAIALGASGTARQVGPLWELPVPQGSPIEREWAVICDAPGIAVCMVGVERPAGGGARRFEALWTTEPHAVRDAARTASAIAVAAAPELAPHVRRLDEPARVTSDVLRASTGLANRIVGYLDAAGRPT